MDVYFLFEYNWYKGNHEILERELYLLCNKFLPKDCFYGKASQSCFFLQQDKRTSCSLLTSPSGTQRLYLLQRRDWTECALWITGQQGQLGI